MKNVRFYKRLKKIRKFKSSKKPLIKLCVNIIIFILITRIMIFFIFRFRRNKIIKPEKPETISAKFQLFQPQIVPTKKKYK